MLDNNTIVKVTNRSHGRIGYYVPELNHLRRTFQSGETKEITAEELRKLSWTSGGPAIIKNCLIIHNNELVQELVPNAEPEYFYDKSDVIALLQSGSLDELRDAIDFAPSGVVDLIKTLAVDVQVNDVAKRDIIKEMTGFDVTKAIEINKEAQQEEVKASQKTRRTGAAEVVAEPAVATPQRRAATPSFSIKKN